MSGLEGLEPGGLVRACRRTAGALAAHGWAGVTCRHWCGLQQVLRCHLLSASVVLPPMLCRSWPLDAAVVAARSTADGMAAWAAQQIRELQQLLSEGLDADARALEEWKQQLKQVSFWCARWGELQGCSRVLPEVFARRQVGLAQAAAAGALGAIATLFTCMPGFARVPGVQEEHRQEHFGLEKLLELASRLANQVAKGGMLLE